MANHVRPREPSYSQPAANPAYTGPGPAAAAPPPPQVQFAPAPPQPPYERPRNHSTASTASYHSGYNQQLVPHPASPGPPQQYYPYPPSQHAPPAQQVLPGQQLHPHEAYAADPFQHRRRTGSTGSAMSHHSTSSKHSNHSAHSRRSSHHSHDSHGRRPGERATLGDTLVGIWSALVNMMGPTKR